MRLHNLCLRRTVLACETSKKSRSWCDRSDRSFVSWVRPLASLMPTWLGSCMKTVWCVSKRNQNGFEISSVSTVPHRSYNHCILWLWGPPCAWNERTHDPTCPALAIEIPFEAILATPLTLASNVCILVVHTWSCIMVLSIRRVLSDSHALRRSKARDWMLQALGSDRIRWGADRGTDGWKHEIMLASMPTAKTRLGSNKKNHGSSSKYGLSASRENTRQQRNACSAWEHNYKNLSTWTVRYKAFVIRYKTSAETVWHILSSSSDRKLTSTKASVSSFVKPSDGKDFWSSMLQRQEATCKINQQSPWHWAQRKWDHMLGKYLANKLSRILHMPR